MKNLRMYAIIAVGMMCITSCEKPEENQIISKTQEEGFMSTTGNSETILMNNDPSTKMIESTQLLHMHFDKELSKEEATAKFNKKVTEFMKTYQSANEKGVSTEWFYRVDTYTGYQNANGTDGTVRVLTWFYTDRGYVGTSYEYLDNSGDDREGGWDFYLLSAEYPGKAVSWVEAYEARLELQGTDGWFVKQFDIEMWYHLQNVPATGYTTIQSDPNVWLDNSTSSGWDHYNTGAIGTGRVSF